MKLNDFGLAIRIEIVVKIANLLIADRFWVCPVHCFEWSYSYTRCWFQQTVMVVIAEQTARIVLSFFGSWTIYLFDNYMFIFCIRPAGLSNTIQEILYL